MDLFSFCCVRAQLVVLFYISASVVGKWDVYFHLFGCKMFHDLMFSFRRWVALVRRKPVPLQHFAASVFPQSGSVVLRRARAADERCDGCRAPLPRQSHDRVRRIFNPQTLRPSFKTWLDLLFDSSLKTDLKPGRRSECYYYSPQLVLALLKFLKCETRLSRLKRIPCCDLSSTPFSPIFFNSLHF